MPVKRRSLNPKREIDPMPDPADLDRWEKEVRYGGNPEHKRNPGNFGLTPPACHRGDNALCDSAGIFDHAIAAKLLRDGIRKGLVSRRTKGEGNYPQNVWAVSEEDIPLEAQLENPGNGTYHGYPMPEEDPLRNEVLRKWRAYAD